MNKVKPKTALAKLLDSVSDMNILDGAEVGIAYIDNDIDEHKEFSETTSDISEHQHFVKTSDSQSIILQRLDPKDCYPWRFADRPIDEMGDLETLAASIKEIGQQEPILVRPAHYNKEIRYEIIFGSRRWRACKLAGVKVLAIIKDVTDQEATLYQKEENENREDISDLARARNYKALIDAGIFKNESELSKKLGISKQRLSDIMSFNRIPERLANAIPNLREVSSKTAIKIAFLAKEEMVMEQLIHLAPKIGSKEITSANIELYLKKLMNPKFTHHSEMFDIFDENGKRLFVFRITASGETKIKIEKNLYGSYDIQKLKEMLCTYLSDCKKEMDHQK
jgi:ParB family chromosome partitioning protein